jgi:uncharacterized delta-60 repeat protein
MKNRLLMLAIVVFSAYASSAFAQSPDTLWTRVYGGNLAEGCYSVQQTTDGGYILAGYTMSYGAGLYDYYLVKTNSSGDTLWTRIYGGTNSDRANGVRQTTDGGYILGGYTNSYGTGSYDFYLVKTNSSGDTLWTRTYGGSSSDYGQNVQQTTDGGYIIAGYTMSFGAGLFDIYLVKTNSSGDTLWTRSYGGSSVELCYTAQQTADGGYILAGSTDSYGAGSSDFYLVKTNSIGDTLWTHTYGGSAAETCRSVQQTTDGGYILAGITNSYGAGSSDFYLVKTNSIGDTLWTHTYGGLFGDYAYEVNEISEGGYILVGYSNSFGGTNDFYLVKTSSAGDTLWTYTCGGMGSDYAYSGKQITDGGYILAGSTNSYGAGGYDFYLVRVEEEEAAPEVPTDFTLTLSLPHAILQWSPVLGISQYHIYKSVTSPYSGFVAIGSTSDTCYTDSSAVVGNNGSFYYITSDNVALDSSNGH